MKEPDPREKENPEIEIPFQRKKRRFQELGEGMYKSDDEEEDNNNPPEENEIGDADVMIAPEKVKLPHKSKKKLQSNLNLIRKIHLMKKKNKENIAPLITDSELDYVKKVADNAHHINIKENQKLSQPTDSNSSFQQVSESCFSISLTKPRIRFEEALDFVGILTGCQYKIISNNEEECCAEVLIVKNTEEKMLFNIIFHKKGDIDYIEYNPLKATFKFIDEDIIFYEPLDIPKEDLGKLLKKFLNYKYEIQ